MEGVVLKSLIWGAGGVEYRVVEIRCRADDCEGNVRV